MKKQVKVVILPTNEAKGDFSKERIYPCLLKHSWMFDKEGKGKLIFTDSNIRTPTQLQHLYFLSDEEIKEGDIVKIPCGIGRVKELHYKLGNDNPSYIVEDLIILSLRYDQKENEFQTNSFRFEDVKKIIASTDESLKLPRPSNEFIKKYCELGGIDEVLVEYKCSYEDCNMFGCHKYEGCHLIQQLKVAPDNTISIYPITNETQFK